MNRPPSHPRLVLTPSRPDRVKPGRSYIAVWGIAGGFAVAAWIVGASVLVLIAVVCFGSVLCLLITADPTERCSRHRIAREVEQDREENGSGHRARHAVLVALLAHDAADRIRLSLCARSVRRRAASIAGSLAS